MERGARGSGPAIVLSTYARSATERPRQPEVLSVRPRESRFRIRHAADRRTESYHVAERGGIAQRAAGVGAADHRREAAGERDGAASGRAAARFRQVVGIARRTENFVERSAIRRRIPGVLVFADGDRAGALHALDDNIVLGGNVVLEEQRTERGANAARFEQILVRDRQAVQSARGFPCAPASHRLLRRRRRPFPLPASRWHSLSDLRARSVSSALPALRAPKVFSRGSARAISMALIKQIEESRLSACMFLSATSRLPPFRSALPGGLADFRSCAGVYHAGPKWRGLQPAGFVVHSHVLANQNPQAEACAT